MVVLVVAVITVGVEEIVQSIAVDKRPKRVVTEYDD
jgi:hypothetical protein